MWRLVFVSLSCALRNSRRFFAVAKSRAPHKQQQNKRVMNLIRLEKELNIGGQKSAKFELNEMCCNLFFMREANFRHSEFFFLDLRRVKFNSFCGWLTICLKECSATFFFADWNIGEVLNFDGRCWRVERTI